VFIDIACSTAVGKLDFMASNLCMIGNWQVCAGKWSWLDLWKSPCIYMM